MFARARVTFIRARDSAFASNTAHAVTNGSSFMNQIFVQQIALFFEHFDGKSSCTEFVKEALAKHNLSLPFENESVNGSVTHLAVCNIEPFDDIACIIDDILKAMENDGFLFTNAEQIPDFESGSLFTFVLPLDIGITADDGHTDHSAQSSSSAAPSYEEDEDEPLRIWLNLNAFQIYKDRSRSVSVLVNCLNASVVLKFVEADDDFVELKGGCVAIFFGCICKIQTNT